MCGNNAPHADVFDDVRKGVSLDLITEMANTGTGLIDVHLLAEGALSAAFDVVCRPGVSGITFPYEGVDDVEAVAGRIRAVGAQPWLAISPATQIERRRTSLCHVDGLLIMLIEPGSKQAADVATSRRSQQRTNSIRPVSTVGSPKQSSTRFSAPERDTSSSAGDSSHVRTNDATRTAP